MSIINSTIRYYIYCALFLIGFIPLGCAVPTTSKVTGSNTHNDREVKESGPDNQWSDDFVLRVGIPNKQLPATQPTPVAKAH